MQQTTSALRRGWERKRKRGRERKAESRGSGGAQRGEIIGTNKYNFGKSDPYAVSTWLPELRRLMHDRPNLQCLLCHRRDLRGNNCRRIDVRAQIHLRPLMHRTDPTDGRQYCARTLLGSGIESWPNRYERVYRAKMTFYSSNFFLKNFVPKASFEFTLTGRGCCDLHCVLTTPKQNLGWRVG